MTTNGFGANFGDEEICDLGQGSHDVLLNVSPETSDVHGGAFHDRITEHAPTLFNDAGCFHSESFKPRLTANILHWGECYCNSRGVRNEISIVLLSFKALVRSEPSEVELAYLVCDLSDKYLRSRVERLGERVNCFLGKGEGPDQTWV